VSRPPAHALTIDVEDWYHCLDSNPHNWHRFEDRVVHAVHLVLDVLRQADTRATFFVLGCVAQRHPALIAQLHDLGHEIACHGYDHQFIYRQSPQEFERDVARSVALLSSIIRQPVLGYRAPYFSITRESLWALPVLKKLGIRYDSSIFPVVNHRYGIPTAPRLLHEVYPGLTEVPVSTYPFVNMNIPCAGGVYFRFLPYRVIRGLFRALSRRGESIVFYLHPWELDAGQPRADVQFFLKTRHYWGLASTADKLSRLLHDFRFGTIKSMLELSAAVSEECNSSESGRSPG